MPVVTKDSTTENAALVTIPYQSSERVTYCRLNVIQHVPLWMAGSGAGHDVSGKESTFPPPGITPANVVRYTAAN